MDLFDRPLQQQKQRIDCFEYLKHDYLKKVWVQSSWKCVCGTHNLLDDKRCYLCNEIRPEHRYPVLFELQMKQLQWIEQEKSRIDFFFESQTQQINKIQNDSMANVWKQAPTDDLVAIIIRYYEIEGMENLIIPNSIKSLILKFANISPILYVKRNSNVSLSSVFQSEYHYLAIILETHAALTVNVELTSDVIFLGHASRIFGSPNIKCNQLIMKNKSVANVTDLDCKYLSKHANARLLVKSHCKSYRKVTFEDRSSYYDQVPSVVRTFREVN